VTEAPERERRWALLALAQYQAARQGDALRTLHQARRKLVDELGVDPGPDLVALEQAILRQEPSLVAASALPAVRPTCPYLGLVPYDVDDTDGYFGRDGEVEACLGRLAVTGVLAVVGPSGSGKSSLVRAGVAAALQRNGRRVLVITPGSRPTDALTALPSSGPAPVLVIDQCEEAVTICEDPDEQAAFFAALTSHAGQGLLVVALRADRLGDVSAHPGFAHLIEPGLHLLGAMSPADLRAAIEGPARQAGLLLEPGLVDLLIREVEGEPGALPLLSHALRETWQRREGRTLTVEGYQRTGGIRGAVAQSAEAVYDQIPDEQRARLRDLLLRLVTPTPEGEPVRSRIPRRTVATDPAREQLIELLVRARLVTSDNDTVELAHESLARAWPRLRGWLDDDVDGQRVLRHLALTADAWDAMGRPSSELYRGVRLAQAVDWHTRANPDLTPAEHAFLDASAEQERTEAQATEERLHNQARQNRRLRALLAGAGVLLVMAMVTGVLAVRQAKRADRAATAAGRAATAADARRVGAQALVAPDLDVSLLLAAEGMNLDDSTDTRNNLLAAVSRSPELIASTRGSGPLISLEPSPDGKLVGVGQAFGGVSFYDTTTRELRGSYNAIPVWKFEFRPDGKQLAFTAQDNVPGGPLVQLVDADTLADEAIQLGDVPPNSLTSAPHYSADGRFLAVSLQQFSTKNTSVLVWNVAAPEHPVQRVELTGGGYEVELSRDGSTLYVGHVDPATVTAYDLATGQVLRSAPVPGSWLELSPDGSLLAVASGSEIVLLDAATLTERRRLQGHSGAIQVIRFSPSGALLASGSDDRTAIVWDVATGQHHEPLRGYSSSVAGVGFSPDEQTLYTTSGHSMLTWDLVGDRRFISQRPLTKTVTFPLTQTVTIPTGAASGSPAGDVVAYSASTTNANGAPIALLQFLDIAGGRVGRVIDTGHINYGATAWRPDGRRFATAGEDGSVRAWDPHTSELVVERHLAPGHIAGLDYTRDGKRLLVAERAGPVYTVDAETLEPDGRRVDVGDELSWGFVSPDNHTAIAIAGDRFALLDLDTGRVIDEDGVGFGVNAAQFSPDGRRFAVGGDAGEVRVLNVDTGKWVGPTTVGHEGVVWQVAFAPDGATFASGADDGAIVLWDGRTGARLVTLASGRPASVAPEFLPDGHSELISSFDGTVATWDTNPMSWAAFVCAVAGRNLTPDEWSNAFGTRPYHQTCPATG
jgi:WD40 repeat protein